MPHEELIWNDATVEVILAEDVPAAVGRTSRRAAVTLLGFDPGADTQPQYFGDFYRNVLRHLDTVILGVERRVMSISRRDLRT